MINDYPILYKEFGEYAIKWYLPHNYHTELLQNISPEFIKTIENEMTSINKMSGAEGTPRFLWLNNGFLGLDKIILGSGSRILLEPLEGMLFRGVKDAREALALLSMLSNYFNKLNSLNFFERSIENETKKT